MLEGVDAGLHVVLRLPDDVDDLDVVSRLAEQGLAASPLSAYAVEATVRGLVLCYAGLPETQADAACGVGRRAAPQIEPPSPRGPGPLAARAAPYDDRSMDSAADGGGNGSRTWPGSGATRVTVARSSPSATS